MEQAYEGIMGSTYWQMKTTSCKEWSYWKSPEIFILFDCENFSSVRHKGFWFCEKLLFVYNLLMFVCMNISLELRGRNILLIPIVTYPNQYIPIFVKATLALLTEMFSPNSLEDAQTPGSFNITNNTNNHHGRCFDYCHSFHNFFLVNLWKTKDTWKSANSGSKQQRILYSLVVISQVNFMQCRLSHPRFNFEYFFHWAQSFLQSLQWKHITYYQSTTWKMIAQGLKKLPHGCWSRWLAMKCAIFLQYTIPPSPQSNS